MRGPHSPLPKFTTQWGKVLHFYRSRTNKPGRKIKNQRELGGVHGITPWRPGEISRGGKAVQLKLQYTKVTHKLPSYTEGGTYTAHSPRPPKSTVLGHSQNTEVSLKALLTLGGPEQCRGLGSTPGLYPVDTRSTPQIVTTPNVRLRIQSLFLSTACQQSP